MRAVRAAIFAAAAVALALAGAENAGAAPSIPRNLTVPGEWEWHTDRTFEVDWAAPEAGSPPVAAVHYVVHDEDGVAEAPGQLRVPWPGNGIEVYVAGPPAAYTVEVWFEDSSGAQGPPASTLLRFDEGRPAAVQLLRPPDWIGRDDLPYPLRVSRPTAAPPRSGIFGYAISVDRDPVGEPCGDGSLCTDAETDLRGGVEGDTRREELPEGVSYAHVVAVSGAGVRSLTTGTATLRVDRNNPITELDGLPPGWSAGPVRLRASAVDALSGMSPADGAFTAIRVDGDAPTVTPGPTATATLFTSGVHAVAYYARDAAGNVDDGSTANGHAHERPAIVVVHIDRDPPRVAFLPESHTGDPELLEARALDALSGPSESRGWIGVRAAGSRRAFDPLPTAIEPDGILRCRWNSDRYPPGEYEFEAVGYDRAGNSGTGDRRASGAPMVLPSPLKTQTRLRGWFAGRGARATERRIAYGSATTFRGHLEQTSGAALAETAVQVVERFARGSGLQPRTTTVLTDAGGDFALRLAAGPSREVSAFYAGSRTRASARSDVSRLAVRTRVRLRISSRTAVVGGRPIVFSGTVAGDRIPADGVAVQLQFHLPGVDWSEFRTVRSDRRGRFRYAYRFSDDDSRGVRFLFRAYVPTQNGDWPYEPDGSLPVAVRGV